ncbi:MAG: hypothetical protein P8Y25_08675, partial [Chromatiaceae bacterium]
EGSIESEAFGELQPKGFSRPRQVFTVKGFTSTSEREAYQLWSRTGDHVEVTVTDSSDIAKAILELKEIEQEFEELLEKQRDR